MSGNKYKRNDNTGKNSILKILLIEWFLALIMRGKVDQKLHDKCIKPKAPPNT